MLILSGEMVQNNKNSFLYAFFFYILWPFGKHERYGPQVSSSDSRLSFFSKPYIDANPSAAHCWPISVHISFNFKVNLSDSLPYPFMPCGWATLETALWLFRVGLQGGWPAGRAACGRVLPL
jgi:hypothetical protein